ncbi:MAG: 2-amino-4-hydroxy-6-hydroxymethyldihydropteridine diphosphokinase [Arcanobacterium sp.]|nr:2-amino-4-hydroxy-6-hydroxymethyldihydropteridine diphosphokinase [Arcanobacterium sp.]
MREIFPTMQEQTIRLTGLRVLGTHGVLASEHEAPQEFSVDVEMVVCTEQAVASDSIAATISYADVADMVVQIVAGKHVDLIETLADRIARQVVHMGARMATVTVHKPQAPIAHAFSDVSATVSIPGVLLTPARRRVVIGIGSNLDVPEAHVIEAAHMLSDFVDVEEVSELYRTVPQLADGQEEQPDYVNAVLTGYTDIPPLQFLQLVHHIEAEHGRVRTKRWEARTLDLDIIDVEGITSADPELIIPHPRAARRRFVLEPWLAIDPAATLGGVPVADLLSEVRAQPVEKMDMAEYMPRVLETLNEWDNADESWDSDSDLASLGIDGTDDFGTDGEFNSAHGKEDPNGDAPDSGGEFGGFEGPHDFDGPRDWEGPGGHRGSGPHRWPGFGPFGASGRGGRRQ